MTTNAARLHATGGLRPGLTLEQVRDVLWTCSAPDLYELVVLRRGWSAERYGELVGQMMMGALLPP